MSIRDEIADACRRLALSPDQFAEVPEGQAVPLTSAFLSHLTNGVDARWWREHFTLPVTSVRFIDGKGFTRIAAVVPDPDEHVWFVAEDDQLSYFSIYSTTPAVAQKVIGECYGFESYLIAKDLSWLLCDNHHDTVMAIGEIPGRLSECGA